MTEKTEGTTSPAAEQKTAPDMSAQLAEAERKLMKYETDLAYAHREIEKLKPAKQERDKMVEDKASTGDPEAIKKIKDEYQGRIASTEEEYKGKLSQVEKELKHERIVKTGLIKAASVFNESADIREFVSWKLERNCDYVDGKIVVKDDKGEPRYSNINKRELMGVDEYVEELAYANPALARPTTGTGSKQQGTKASAGRTITLDQYVRMTDAEQRAAKLSPEVARDLLRQLGGIPQNGR